MPECHHHRGITFIPGFLGDKDDWNEVIAYLGDFKTSEKVLVGYSMGGRIALQEKYDKAIVFSAHPGLKSEEEKQTRLQEDLQWIEILRTKSFEDFLALWYERPLFASLKQNTPLFEKTLERRRKQDPKKLISQLEKYGLAQQTFAIPKNTLFVCGEKDLKYVELYRKVLPTQQYKIIEGCGHAAHLESPEQCAVIIKEYLNES